MGYQGGAGRGRLHPAPRCIRIWPFAARKGLEPLATTTQSSEPGPRVGLFVTCIVDLFRPSVGFAAVKLLEDAGCRVEVPLAQTCCGQPGYNSGFRADAAAIARQVIELFEGYDYVVAPSGSCGGMLRKHYPLLLADDPDFADRSKAFSKKVYELISFLVDVRGVSAVDVSHSGTVAYHDACSGLRELGVREQPRRLLRSIEGLEIKEMSDPDACCGFGGAFSVKYPDISNAIADQKIRQIADINADTLLAGDLGCLMQLAGKLSREGRPVAAQHVAEVLAGMTDEPPIGAPASRQP